MQSGVLQCSDIRCVGEGRLLCPLGLLVAPDGGELRRECGQLGLHVVGDGADPIRPGGCSDASL